MKKYELALVLSAKIEDEERAAMLEKVQAIKDSLESDNKSEQE